MITVNNFTELDVYFWRRLKELKAGRTPVVVPGTESLFAPEWLVLVNRFVVCHETGEQGTEHLQAFISFNSPQRQTRVQLRMFSGILCRASVIPAKGSAAQNYAYCSKSQRSDRLFVEFGSFARKAAKLDEIDLKLYDNFPQFCEANPTIGVKYASGLRAYFEATAKPTMKKRKGYWLCGPTGAGKTLVVNQRFPGAVTVQLSGQPMAPFFNGYNGETTVVLSELRKSSIAFSTLLGLLDDTAQRVNVKGSSVPWNADIVVVTAPMRPEVMYREVDEDVEQLLRRFEVVELTRDEGVLRELLGDQYDPSYNARARERRTTAVDGQSALITWLSRVQPAAAAAAPATPAMPESVSNVPSGMDQSQELESYLDSLLEVAPVRQDAASPVYSLEEDGDDEAIGSDDYREEEDDDEGNESQMSATSWMRRQ